MPLPDPDGLGVQAAVRGGWREVVIASRHGAAEGIAAFDLVPADGASLPPFDPGAHIDVEVGPGLIRQYSLYGDPRDTGRYRIAVLLEAQSRGGSAGVHGTFAQGARIRIADPRNNFPLCPTARHSVLVAGGIGITPLLAMAHHLRHRSESFELHYCFRERRRAAFLDLLATARFAERTQLHADDGDAGQRFAPATALGTPRPGVHVYICGPTGFMDWVIAEAQSAGWPADQLHMEYFTADVDTAGAAFIVEARRSGRTIPIRPDQTIAAALLEAGVDVPLSCEQGVCGTCLVGVLDGVPDHRDVYQTDEEKAANTHIACCCSRARSPVLVLDI